VPTPDVTLVSLDCNSDPEEVEITNQGTAAQDLTAWTLQSDPTSDPNQLFDLTPVGTLDPGESANIFSGSGAPATDAVNNVYLWSLSFKFRDNDDTDFVRLVDAQGATIAELACQVGTPTPTPTPSATATATPTTGPSGLPPTGSGMDGSIRSWLLMAVGIALAVVGGIAVARPRLPRINRG
jgi:hypothetical protein